MDRRLFLVLCAAASTYAFSSRAQSRPPSVKPQFTKPVLISQAPVAPIRYLKIGDSAHVTISCYIEPDGKTSDVRALDFKVLDGSGNDMTKFGYIEYGPELKLIAEDMVKRYKFKPATKDGVPTKVRFVTEVYFKRG